MRDERPRADRARELRERVGRGLEDVRARIARAGGDPAKVTVVAVTKGFGPEAAEAALSHGVRDIGENYAAELSSKALALAGPGAAAAGAGPVRWHYLGRVQRRKVRALAPLVSLWQSVARAVEGDEIARRAPGAAVLVEVDTTGRPERFGAAPADTAQLVAHLLALGLDVRGLMVVGAPGGGAGAGRAFETVASLADDLGLPVRSMGMSGDLDEAVRAGTTMVRVGEALFGPRTAARGLAQ